MYYFQLSVFYAERPDSVGSVPTPFLDRYSAKQIRKDWKIITKRFTNEENVNEYIWEEFMNNKNNVPFGNGLANEFNDVINNELKKMINLFLVFWPL